MKLVKITADRVQIKSNDEVFATVKINDLFKISDGTETIITIVIAITDNDVSVQDDDVFESLSLKVIECSIIGCVKDNVFIKAIDNYPTTDVKIELVNPEMFMEMMSKYNQGFKLGEYSGYKTDAFINGNKFFQRHSAILGNTGSGKSETVARILEEASKLKSKNIIVYDIHGEYSDLPYVSRVKIGKDINLPIWLFGFSDIVANIFKVKEETSTVVMSALRQAFYAVCDAKSESKPYYFDYQQFVNEIENMNQEMIDDGVYSSGEKKGFAKVKKGDLNGKLNGVLNIAKDKMLDSRYKFMFEPSQQTDVFWIAEDILGTQKSGIKVIDFSDVPHDVIIPIIGVITRLIYELQLLNDKNPVSIICDEAHVYIPNNFNLSPSERRLVEIFEQIAKEGRKFGITIIPVSQRPSELNKTIIAQCGNFLILKLNNDTDKQIIKGMIPSGDSNLIDNITMFSPGDGIIIGDAAPIPLKIKIKRASVTPNSNTIDFWSEWDKEIKFKVDDLVTKYLELE